MMKKIFISVIIIIVLLVAIYIILGKINKGENIPEVVNETADNTTILYSWDMKSIVPSVRGKLITTIKNLNIGTIYQDFSTSFLQGTDNEFIKDMDSNKVTVYQLTGDPSWGADTTAKSMKREIDKIVNYNDKVEYKIKGIVMDVEVYTGDNYSGGYDYKVFQTYVDSMIEAHKYAQEKGISFVVVIPYWLDQVGTDLLESLIRDGADEVSVMNYNIKNTVSNIEQEVAYAKKYNKGISTIYEVNFSSTNCFNNYAEIDADYNKIFSTYNYNQLRKAYHHYGLM